MWLDTFTVTPVYGLMDAIMKSMVALTGGTLGVIMLERSKPRRAASTQGAGLGSALALMAAPMWAAEPLAGHWLLKSQERGDRDAILQIHSCSESQPRAADSNSPIPCL